MKYWVVMAAACVLGAGLWAAGQQPAVPANSPKSDDLPTLRVDVTRVNLLFTVTDKKGRFVTDLAKRDIDVVENSRLQVIDGFTAESDLPLRLAILIDTSGSIRERFRFEQEAAIEFIEDVIHPHVDKAVVVSFDTEAQLRSELVDDPIVAANAIRDLHPGGGTALYDAIYYVCRDKLLQDQPRDKFRRAVVIVSDGDDNMSDHTRDQALEMAQDADAVIYAISTNITKLETEGDRVLKYYAQQTGGVAFFPFKVEELSQSFVDIANELRSQYSAAYRPEPLVLDGMFHKIAVRVKNRKDLVVHVRTGYYARKM
jgi:Ca-activated chloride channel homolog